MLQASVPAGAYPPGADLPVLWGRELLEDGPAGLSPSALARSLAGRRVRLIGFMARMEEPETHGFWLAPRPVECDEGGAGTGDLPAGSVRVLLAAGSEPAGHLAGPIVVTGVLQVGGAADPDGTTSDFRLLADPPAPAVPGSAAHPQ